MSCYFHEETSTEEEGWFVCPTMSGQDIHTADNWASLGVSSWGRMQFSIIEAPPHPSPGLSQQPPPLSHGVFDINEELTAHVDSQYSSSHPNVDKIGWRVDVFRSKLWFF